MVLLAVKGHGKMLFDLFIFIYLFIYLLIYLFEWLLSLETHTATALFLHCATCEILMILIKFKKQIIFSSKKVYL